MNGKYPVFREFRQKIKYLKNLNEIVSLYNKYIEITNDIAERQLIKSVLFNIKTHKIIDPFKFMINIDMLERVDNYNDAREIYDELIKNTDDKAQLKTLLRLIKNKPSLNNVEKSKENGLRIIKNCPHCKKPCIASPNQEYIVCGYNDTHNGYDWIGCGKDWCFRCGKKLCKNWNNDSLFNPQNRYHDKKCCRKDAEKNGLNYTNDYCQCSTSYVRRTEYRVPFFPNFT